MITMPTSLSTQLQNSRLHGAAHCLHGPDSMWSPRRPSSARLGFLWLPLLAVLLLAIPDRAPCQEDGGGDPRKASMEAAAREYRILDTEGMLKFYSENAPDLLEEWERRCRTSVKDGTKYMGMLARHYSEICSAREKSEEEYARLVRQQKTEFKVRSLSRQIQKLAADKSDGDKLARLKLELRNVMETAFDETQKRQAQEINRLENELRTLKELVKERAANKDVILRQRFALLTGQDWPGK